MLLFIRSADTGMGVRLDNGIGLNEARLDTAGGTDDDDDGTSCKVDGGGVRQKTLFEMDDGDVDESGDKEDELSE